MQADFFFASTTPKVNLLVPISKLLLFAGGQIWVNILFNAGRIVPDSCYLWSHVFVATYHGAVFQLFLLYRCYSIALNL
jgi:hypothetical protein